ncbi:FUT1 [Cordylochernes scorpioides]|uniref:L-Fucosyltransferase n=1 Tax=Cordylochernes scorpioides TaxID=51811 RepID=A0ABY6K0H8_9ARAC|nr:FUT1 [Cordylochernes scorpioides]
MGTYATLLGLAHFNHRTPYVLRCNYEKLEPYFKITAVDIISINVPEEHSYHISSFLRKEDKFISQNKILLKGYLYPLSFTFFHHIRDKIRSEFSFNDEIINRVENYLAELRLVYGNASTLVSIHVRRTDYKGWLNTSTRKGRQVDMEYFNRAMKYFEERYEKVVFVVMSDDRKWCKKNFANKSNAVLAPPVSEPAVDMALISRCHHHIMSYGSFGFWGAYLGGGTTVFFADFLPPDSTYLLNDMPYNVTYLPEWVGISTTPPGFWKTPPIS